MNLIFSKNLNGHFKWLLIFINIYNHFLQFSIASPALYPSIIASYFFAIFICYDAVLSPANFSTQYFSAPWNLAALPVKCKNSLLTFSRFSQNSIDVFFRLNYFGIMFSP